MKIQKLVGTVILLAGVALLIVGLTLQVPGTYLTTYASLDGAAIRLRRSGSMWAATRTITLSALHWSVRKFPGLSWQRRYTLQLGCW